MNPIRHFQHALNQRYFIFGCYGVLLALYLVIFWPNLFSALRYPDVLVAPIMSLGSFVAGSTFLGGGAVAFPALTKVLGTDPQTAKSFSFAIQSVGMTSASLYILSRVPRLPFKFIFTYVCAAGIGLTVSLISFQGLFTAADIRIGFTLFVLCFLIIYLWTHKNISGHPEAIQDSTPFDHEKIVFSPANNVLIFVCGFIGGGISGLIGSGADLLGFCLLALYFRIEIKLATQVSVIVMACVSVLGISIQGFFLNDIPPGITNLWYIAAPIVLFGAPLGAIFCKRTTSTSLIVFITAIVFVEVVSTVFLVSFEKEKLLFYIFVFSAALVFLTLLYRKSPYHVETNDSF